MGQHLNAVGVYSNDTMSYYKQYMDMTNTVGTYLDLFVKTYLIQLYDYITKTNVWATPTSIAASSSTYWHRM